MAALTTALLLPAVHHAEDIYPAFWELLWFELPHRISVDCIYCVRERGGRGLGSLSQATSTEIMALRLASSLYSVVGFKNKRPGNIRYRVHKNII